MTAKSFLLPASARLVLSSNYRGIGDEATFPSSWVPLTTLAQTCKCLIPVEKHFRVVPPLNLFALVPLTLLR